MLEGYLSTSKTLLLIKLISRRRRLSAHCGSGRRDDDRSPPRTPQLPIEVIGDAPISAIELIEHARSGGAGLRANRAPASARRGESEKWLEAWVKLGGEATREAAAGPTATEILASDRRRLERR